jgi:hypothetical protein
LLSTHHAELPQCPAWTDPQSSFWSKSQNRINRERRREIGTQIEWRQNHQPRKTKKTKQQKKKKKTKKAHGRRMMESVR